MKKAPVKYINTFSGAFFIISLLLSVSIPATAHPPVSLVMDSKGNVYFSDLEQVWKLAASGKLSVAVPNVHTHELYIDSQDRLFGEHVLYLGEQVNKYRHRVWRLSPDGSLKNVVPEKEGYPDDYGFTYDRAGNMYWLDQAADRALRKRTPQGKVSVIATGNFRDTNWLTVTPGGTVYFVRKGDLMKVEPGKAPVTVKRLSESGPKSPGKHYYMGLWTDTQGNVYVSNAAEKKVLKISPAGKITTPVRCGGKWAPSGGCTSSDGSIWVLEYSLANEVRVCHIKSKTDIKVYRPNSR